MNEYGWKGERIVWMKCKTGLMKYICFHFCILYASVKIKTAEGKSEQRNSRKI